MKKSWNEDYLILEGLHIGEILPSASESNLCFLLLLLFFMWVSTVNDVLGCCLLDLVIFVTLYKIERFAGFIEKILQDRFYPRRHSSPL